MNPKILTFGIAGLLLIILIQNTQVVSIQFLFWNVVMSRILLILFCFLLGGVAGFLLGRKQF